MVPGPIELVTALPGNLLELQGRRHYLRPLIQKLWGVWPATGFLASPPGDSQAS